MIISILFIPCLFSSPYKNIKQYAIVSIFFLVGIIAGVIITNYSQIETKQQIGSYITTFIDCLKTDYQIDSINLLKNIIGNHIVFAFILWFMGCTIIGIPVVYGLVVYRGFSLGYTISIIIFTLGTGKGILFCVITLLLQNLKKDLRAEILRFTLVAFSV